MSKKIAAFGMDGFVTPMMKYFAAEGVLPNFTRLLEQGVVNQTEPSFPVWTPTNWATLSTGAHTGTHDVTTWFTEIAPGQPVSSFDGRANQAERIWNALERAGLRGVAVHYPAAHPSGVQIGFVVDGYGHPGHTATDFEVAAAQAYTTKPDDSGAVVMAHDGTAAGGERGIEPIPALTPADEWANLPSSQLPPLASTVAVVARLGGDRTLFHLLVIAEQGNAYDTVLICRQPDASTQIATTRVGGWSDWAIEPFQIEGRTQSASVRFKLMRLSPDGADLKLYRTQITYTSGFTYGDEDLAQELIRRFGPYQEHASMTPYTSGMTDFTTALEECEYQGMWFANVANYMLYERDCSYFTCHWHLYDYLNHIHLNDVDPECPGYDPDSAHVALDYFRRAYQVGDRILGQMWQASDAHADQESYISILADHGAYPDIRVTNISQFLLDHGFLVLSEGQARAEQDDIHYGPGITVDMQRTKAYMKRRGFDITINAKAGTPEFSAIERELLTALRTWVDEETGRTPVAIALPKRDAYLLGQWGDQCGDVIWAWDHGYVSGYIVQWEEILDANGARAAVGAPKVFGAHHGGFLPTDNGFSSTFGSMLLVGPGLKAGYERPTDKLGYIHAADVVPTFCHILDIAPPIQSQGAIAYDLFAGHDMVPSRIKG